MTYIPSAAVLGGAERSEATTSSGIDAVVATVAEIESLRGVTDAAADVSECVCPDACERDHANE